MVVGVSGTFVSRKVGKARWVPYGEYGDGNGNGNGNGEGAEETAVTGDWDVGEGESCVRLWRRTAEEDCLRQRASAPLAGDVAGLEVLSGGESGSIAVADGSGSARLLASSTLALRHEWPRLHRFACTGLSCHDGDIATVGEDGRMNLLAIHRPDAVRSLEEADVCGLTCVHFLKHNEVMAGNPRGRVKIWDLRGHGEGPVATLAPNGEGGAATCATSHPARRHLVLVGDEGGSIAAWDLRARARPVSYVEAHSGAVLEMLFHPERPERLFTCSAGGETWRWNAAELSENRAAAFGVEGPRPGQAVNRPDLDVRSLMADLHQPVNSLDCDGERLICGCDNEAIYIIGDIFS